MWGRIERLIYNAFLFRQLRQHRVYDSQLRNNGKWCPATHTDGKNHILCQEDVWLVCREIISVNLKIFSSILIWFCLLFLRFLPLYLEIIEYTRWFFYIFIEYIRQFYCFFEYTLVFPAHFCKLAEETDIWTFRPLQSSNFHLFSYRHIPIFNP